MINFTSSIYLKKVKAILSFGLDELFAHTFKKVNFLTN